MVRFVITALILIVSSTGEAQNLFGKARETISQARTWLNDCSSVDLRSRFPPIRDQDSVGWCSSYAAADLLSFKTGRAVSAVGVALAYNNTAFNDRLLAKGSVSSEASLSGGDAPKNAAAAIRSGLCLEAELPSDDYSFAQLKDLVEFTTQLKRKISRAKRICTQGETQIVRQLFPALTLAEANEALVRSSYVKVIDYLAARSCKRKLRVIKPLQITAHVDRERPAALFTTINEQLSQNNPLTIGYDANFYYDIDRKGKPGGHDSTIVGRAFNRKTNKCEYIIRNSWGRNCDVYDRRLHCDNGYIFVPRDVLEKRIWDVSYIH